ncbi:MAG: hypothetical protein EBU90_20410 [Proteobacteria bacterium]|nr:hypothetical protein [Pseudomonadota bacterium]
MNARDIQLLNEAYQTINENDIRNLPRWIQYNWEQVKEAIIALGIGTSLMTSIIATSALAQRYIDHHPEVLKYGPMLVNWLGQHKDLLAQWLNRHPDVLEKIVNAVK